MPLYKQDPNNTKKQIPDVSGVSGTGRFSHAILPGHELVQKRCSYVIVNTVGKYSFLYCLLSKIYSNEFLPVFNASKSP